MKFKVDMEPTYNNANIFLTKKSKFKKYSYVFYFVFF